MSALVMSISLIGSSMSARIFPRSGSAATSIANARMSASRGGDGSVGVHNTDYAEHLLVLALGTP